MIESNSDIDHTVVTDSVNVDKLDGLYVTKSTTDQKREPVFVTDIKIDPQVPDEDVNLLMDLINNYRNVFAKNELGCTNVLEMDITEVPGSIPVNMKPYRTSPSDYLKIAQILQDWRNNG